MINTRDFFLYRLQRFVAAASIRLLKPTESHFGTFRYQRSIATCSSHPIHNSSNMTLSLFARNLARRTVERSLRAQVAPQFGSLRFSSYFTPGTSLPENGPTIAITGLRERVSY